MNSSVCYPLGVNLIMLNEKRRKKMKLDVLFAGVAVGVGALLSVGALMAGWTALIGKKLLWVSDERGAFILVAALGFMACTAVMWLGLQRAQNNWLDPFILCAVILGVAIILLGFADFMQMGPAWMTGRAAFHVLLTLIAAKFLLATGHALAKGLV
jgi:hypothetical protein